MAGVDGISTNGLPDGVTVLPLSEAAERLPELTESRLGSIVPADDAFVAHNDAAWSEGVLVHVAAGTALSEPIRLSVVHPGRWDCRSLADADRARGERRGRGVGVLQLRGRRVRGPLQRCHRGDRRAGGPVAPGLGAGSLRAHVAVRHPARRGRARRDARVGGARVRLGPRQDADGDAACRPGVVGEGDRRLCRQRPAAPRLRHHPGARRTPHELRPRLPRGTDGPRERGLERDDPRRPLALRRPTPFRRAATCCSPTRRTPTRSRGSRSRPTTFAAPTPRPSPRSTASSCTICAPTACPTRTPSG